MMPLPSKTNIAAAFLGCAGPMETIAHSDRNALRILAYHRVLSPDTARPGGGMAGFAFDDGVISASTEGFYRQMSYVQRNFNVVSFKDIYAAERQAGALPPRPLIVTFDDGYRDNYTNAFPVLKELGVPATIFVATSHMGSKSLFWWDLVAYCINTTERTDLTLDEISGHALPLGTSCERRVAIARVLAWVKMVPEKTKARFVRDLPAALGVEIPPDLSVAMHLSWDEIREMADCGIEFGSHAVSHPVLSKVDDDQLEREVVDSKAALQRELGKEAIVFSYPVGGQGNFDARTRAAVIRAGYKYAVSYIEGVGRTVDLDRYAMPRIHVEADHSLNRFRANLRFPSLMLRSAAR